MLEIPSEKFLDKLASSAATPGGGSVAALMGSMSAALVSMVGNLTVGKKKYSDVEDEVNDIIKRSEDLRQKLQEAVAQDVEAFDSVMAAYGLPKNTQEEQVLRSEEIQKRLVDAIQAPLDCAKLSCEVLPLSERIAEIGNINIISDAGVAALAARAAFKSAALNVFVNAAALSDKDLATSKIREVRELMKIVENIEGKVFIKVSDTILKN
ncbi:MAG: hypothetical protein CBC42_01700 [Betaproteobacteria bacterium TMED82]|nr:MAG: hypothetical protein CBC42_01700 [Betaproteobacteria bacterium TMED82]|tara:strand:+ start:10345 stop:10974 length:630 start_codon:yes stop_codon:yes gene_type:complete